MSEPNIAPAETIGYELPRLERSYLEPRALRSGLLTLLTWLLAVIASVPLFSVL
jgi:phosphate transport system permease protein